MFGLFENNRAKKAKNWRAANEVVSSCRVFYREPLRGPGVYVEVRGEGDHIVYVSNRGVTPAFLNTPYDQWCREELEESYVFATLDSALDYFQRRASDGVAPDLLTAIRGQSAF